MNRDSGTMRGKRLVWGGRAPVRRLFYDRLRAAEKPFEVAATGTHNTRDKRDSC